MFCADKSMLSSSLFLYLLSLKELSISPDTAFGYRDVGSVNLERDLKAVWHCHDVIKVKEHLKERCRQCL